MDWLTFSIVIALLLVSAFFAAGETALTGASRASMLRLTKQGNRDAAVVTSLLAMREPDLVTEPAAEVDEPLLRRGYIQRLVLFH